MENIIHGTQYTYSLVGLKVVGLTDTGFSLNYSEGLKVYIDVSNYEDRIKQYNLICKFLIEHSKNV